MKLIGTGLVVLWAFVVVSCQLVPSESRPRKPLWTTDLRKGTHHWDYSHTPAFFQAMRQIAFGSTEEVVVANDSGPFPKPNDVHGFVMDARNGGVLKEVQWTSGSWPFLFATSTGKYAVITESGMAVYSQGFQTILATGSHVADKASPDGRFLSVTEAISGHGTTLFIDPDTLKPNGTEFRDVYVWSISENRVASSALRNDNGIVLITDLRKQLPEYETDCGNVRPNFITNELLAVVGCERVDVVSLTNGKMFSLPIKGGEAFFGAASRDGSRFAIYQSFDRAGDPPRLTAERITVVDVVQRRPVFVTDISTLRGSIRGESSGVALSPNGSSVAINSAGIVRFFPLPGR
jgi:hypothetical protein